MDDDGFDILAQPAIIVALRLLGSYFVRELDGHTLIGKIVETEAYDQTDAASHSYHGRTARTEVMFGPPGHLYVYFTYGMHYCCNIVTGPEGHGSAVLIRALEPIAGEDIMSINRHGLAGAALTNGPAKVCQAFRVDKALNGHNLHQPPLRLILRPEMPPAAIIRTTRIGIRKATEMPWRFYVADSPFVTQIKRNSRLP